MPVTLISATLDLQPSDPNLSGKKVGVQSARWRGDACVRFTNEQGKKFLVGFVQLLERNVMQALYTKTKKTEVLKPGYSIPIRDGNKNLQYRPFYGTLNPATIFDVPDNGQHDVNITMRDEPESHYDWWHNNDRTDPLQEFVMNMQFQTYVATRDITAGFQLTDPWVMTFHKQWAVTLDRRIKFTVVARTSGPKADVNETKATTINPGREVQWHKIDNVRAPAEGLLKSDDVANGAFKDEITPLQGRVIAPGIQNFRNIFGP